MNTHLYIRKPLATATRWLIFSSLVSTNPEWLPDMALMSNPAAVTVLPSPALLSTHRCWVARAVIPDNLSPSWSSVIYELLPVKFAYPGLCAIHFLASWNSRMVSCMWFMCSLFIWLPPVFAWKHSQNSEGGKHSSGNAWYIFARSMSPVNVQTGTMGANYVQSNLSWVVFPAFVDAHWSEFDLSSRLKRQLSAVPVDILVKLLIQFIAPRNTPTFVFTGLPPYSISSSLVVKIFFHNDY